MRADRAIQELEALKGEAEPNPLALFGTGLSGWQTRVKTVIQRSLGSESRVLRELDKVRYVPSFPINRSTPQSTINSVFSAGVRTACSLIDAAIYELRLVQEDVADAPLDNSAYDPELWDHVKGLVAAEEWDKIPSAVATFVEDRVREWSGEEPGMVGKNLFAKVLNNESPWRLGLVAGEWEGWRGLGTGFAQALSNVDRHRVQKRGDAKRYAVGVLGLGSLLLTQLRYEHPDLPDLFRELGA